ncbi:MAG: DUF4410 domain-containing protein [Terracidiphilus sp.]
MFRPAIYVLSICAIAVLTAGTAQAQGAPQNPLAGSTQVRIVRGYSGTDPLPKPDLVQVYDFVVPPEAVAMDESAAGRIHARRSLRKGVDETSPYAVAAHVQAVFSQVLVKALQKAPIPAGRALDAAPDVARRTLLVRGEFTSVDQGNATKRVMVGFGRGASSIRAHVTLTLTAGGAPVLVSEFELRSASGVKPGAVATMGVGSLAVGAAAGDATDKKATVDGDASRLAKAVAKQIAGVMAAQKWIPSPGSDESNPQ